MSGLGENLSLYYAYNGYQVILRDEDVAASFMYYLYQNRTSDLYLMRIETVSSIVREHKFYKPSSTDVTSVWSERADFSYGYPYPVFKDMQ